jgi:dTDP-4-amino-4,6-dideoxygalactose transaminase
LDYNSTMKYIGGEIELENATTEISANNNKQALKKFKLYSSGRTAIKYILKSLDPNFPILVPSFLCESILQPLKEAGIAYKFYAIKKDLTIDLDHLRELMSSSRFSALYFIHFFGFVSDPSTLAEIKRLDENLVLIEDCTHLTFIPRLVTEFRFMGDISYGSLRKTLPISDGAFIYSNKYSAIEEPTKEDDDFSRLKLLGKKLRWLYLNQLENKHLESVYLDLLQMAEERISTETPDSKISNKAITVLENLDFEKVYQKRRENYQSLLCKLSNDILVKKIGYVLKSFSEFDMPYMLPFYVNNGQRNRLRHQLRGNGVFTAIIWELPQEINPDLFKESIRLSDNILCFPIDQRYSKDDIEHVFKTLKGLL